MKRLFSTIFDFIFPRSNNDAAIFDTSPKEFYEKIPRWHGEAYPDMCAIFHYQHPTAKAMIKELKSSRNEHAARIAAFALANFFQENCMGSAVIVPMPISKERRKKRGYNQCEFLAEYFMKEMSERENEGRENEQRNQGRFEVCTDILVKPFDTAKFALENRAARIKAVNGIFRASRGLCGPEKHFIVLDDVITTGSTMGEAIKTLRAAGAKSVFGVGIAH